MLVNILNPELLIVGAATSRKRATVLLDGRP
jgi:hypothetical protein